MGHEEAWPFQEAVAASDVPDYYTVIKARSARQPALGACRSP